MTAPETNYRIFKFCELGSTNDQAKTLVNAGFCDGTAIIADHQTAGRGRSGRSRQNLEGNLACSFIVSPHVAVPRLSELSFVIAVALRKCIAGVLPEPHVAKLKWPNDLLIGDAKLSGILLEVATGPVSERPSVIVGVGVNVAAAPDGIDRPVVSLQSLGCDIDAAALFSTLAEGFFKTTARWETAGLKPILADWLDHAAGLGEEIVVRAGKTERTGIFEALDDSGALILRLADGGVEKFTAGDVFLS